MATEINHDTIKTKIKAILEANTSLYTTSAEDNKVKLISVGEPLGDTRRDRDFPHIYITNAINLDTIQPAGTILSESTPLLIHKHTINYRIVVVVNESDSRESESELDRYQKIIMETLEADPQLVGTGSAEVDFAYPTPIEKEPTTEPGNKIKDRAIILKCTKVTA